MKNIFLRTKQVANYIVKTRCTIRAAAKAFGMAKSTVHYDLQNRLKHFDLTLYGKVCEVLDENFNQKNIRGGEATKQKYLNKKVKKAAQKTKQIK